MAKSVLATWRSLFKATNLIAIKELFDLEHTEIIKKHLTALFILIFMGLYEYNATT